MSKMPLVSVVIPAYNAEPFIGEALRSVLAQSYRNLEVIVVDDGSKDATSRIAESIAATDGRVSVLHQQNRGVAAARNLAIERSKGEYIAPLDADDIWYSEKIEKQVERMKGVDPATGLVYGWYAEIDPQGAFLTNGDKWEAEGLIYDALALRNFVGGGSMPLIKRACVEKVGGYSILLRERGGEGCEDWELYLRIAEHYQFRVVPEYLVGHRRHSDNMSSNRRAMAVSQKLVIEGIERSGKPVPARILRWTKGRRCIIELRTAYRNQEYRSTLALALEALRWDPAGLLAFLYGTLMERIFPWADVHSESPEIRKLAFRPFGLLSLKRWNWVTRHCAGQIDDRNRHQRERSNQPR